MTTTAKCADRFFETATVVTKSRCWQRNIFHNRPTIQQWKHNSGYLSTALSQKEYTHLRSTELWARSPRPWEVSWQKVILVGWLVGFSVWWNRLTDWLWKFNAQSTAVVMSGRNAGHQIASNKKSNARTTHVQVQNYKNRVRYVSLIYASHKKSILCLIFFQCV